MYITMAKISMNDYDNEFPKAMQYYIKHNGAHFNKRLCDFAVSLMEKEDGPIKPFTKAEVDTILERNNIKLRHNKLYDYVYVANMCKADFLGSSIMDESHLAKYVKDVIEDPDAEDGIIFNRWYADMCYIDEPIDWEEMI